LTNAYYGGQPALTNPKVVFFKWYKWIITPCAKRRHHGGDAPSVFHAVFRFFAVTKLQNHLDDDDAIDRQGEYATGHWVSTFRVELCASLLVVCPCCNVLLTVTFLVVCQQRSGAATAISKSTNTDKRVPIIGMGVQLVWNATNRLPFS
jgi:hypothetical protein